MCSLISQLPHSAPPVCRDMLSARMALGKTENLRAVCADLAERILGREGHPPAPVTIPRVGDDHCCALGFTDINPALTPEARGKAVLERRAVHLAPTLAGIGGEVLAAHAAALEMAALLGEREFATLEQSATERATNHQMRGAPASTTQIALGQDGEVLVHKTAQWAHYLDRRGGAVGSRLHGAPVLKASYVTGFRLTRTENPLRRTDASGAKQFALHGNVRRWRLETPDAEPKATLTRRTFLDAILPGRARPIRRASLHLEPPDWSDERPWETSPSAPPDRGPPLKPLIRRERPHGCCMARPVGCRRSRQILKGPMARSSSPLSPMRQQRARRSRRMALSSLRP